MSPFVNRIHGVLYCAPRGDMHGISESIRQHFRKSSVIKFYMWQWVLSSLCTCLGRRSTSLLTRCTSSSSSPDYRSAVQLYRRHPRLPHFRQPITCSPLARCTAFLLTALPCVVVRQRVVQTVECFCSVSCVCLTIVTGAVRSDQSGLRRLHLGLE